MKAVTNLRLAALEKELKLLTARIEQLEGERASAPTKPKPPAEALAQPAEALAQPATPGPEARPPVASRRRSLDLEEFLGGRLLALVGGVAVLVGVAFFVSLAIERGWIGESTRVGLAFAGSAALLALGVWLFERRGRGQAALAMTAAAVGSLYLTLAAASELYRLIPTGLALLGALAIGSLATALALRWSSRTVAALGIGGALAAPAVADSLTSAGMVFLVIASAAASAVLVWRRWDWLAIGAFALVVPQVAVWALDASPDAELVVLLGAFAGITLVGALGHAVRTGASHIPEPARLLVVAGALAFGAFGFSALPHAEGEIAGGLWLAGLAVAYGLIGALALFTRRIQDELALLVLGAGLTLANVSFGLLADGVVLPIGWALSAAAFAAIAHRYQQRSELVALTLGSQLSLAIAHTLLFEAPPGALDAAAPATAGVDAVSALAAVLVTAFACARLVLEDERRTWSSALDAVSLAALIYMSATVLDGTELVLAFGAQALVIAELARRTLDPLARTCALVLLAFAAGHALVFEAPPEALLRGADSLAAAALALGAVALTAFRCGRSGPFGSAREPMVLLAAGIAALLLLASIAIVTPFQPGAGAPDTGLGLGVRQQGQVLLSAFWGACGFAALWLGLRRRSRELRLAGFALLAVAAGKVFLYDLSTLGSVYRVLSFVALGLLLLTAAYVYQRARPGPTGGAQV